ncbi:MAG: hypothetical protein A3H27_19285 [Acidobacteria bacterium RIFCSPLOWO2_02_FULL_59_13]|nr:MAG: hypothetical protein A3H27_19285 [Acidobacteria bacterium RIFCSPLOWO2_02_FULL_59_13]
MQPAEIDAWKRFKEEHAVSQHVRTNVETPTGTAQATGDQDGGITWELWFARALVLFCLLVLIAGGCNILVGLLGLR